MNGLGLGLIFVVLEMYYAHLIGLKNIQILKMDHFQPTMVSHLRQQCRNLKDELLDLTMIYLLRFLRNGIFFKHNTTIFKT